MQPSITIRRSTSQDTTAIERLAALDSRRAPAGDALLAFSGDELRAALPIDDPGEPIADPFEHTAAIIDLLKIRAAHLRAQSAPRRRLSALRLRAA